MNVPENKNISINLLNNFCDLNQEKKYTYNYIDM